MIGTLKAEMVGEGTFEDELEARRELFAYLDSYYNTKRKHSALGYQTPAQFERASNELAQEGGLDVGGQGGRALLPVAS
jgi:transposase InsO family protein